MGGFLKHAIWTGGDLGKGSRNPIMFLANGSMLTGQDRLGAVAMTAQGALRYAPGPGGRINYSRNPQGTQLSINGAGVVTPNIPVTDHPLPLVTTAGRITGAVTNDGGTFTGTLDCYFDPTQPMTISFYAKLESGAGSWGIRPSLRRVDGSGITDGAGTNYTLTTDWQRFTHTFTPTAIAAGMGWLNVKFIRTATDAGASALFTAVQIEQGSSATPYFDGSFPGCAWASAVTGIPGTSQNMSSMSKAVFWAEEATTNLVINPSAENASVSTGTTPFGTTAPTITKDTTYALFGSSAFKVVTAGAGPTEGIGIISASSLGYTGSARTFVASGYLRGSGQVDVYARVLYTDLSPADTVHITYTLTDAWTRIIPAAITLDPLKTVNQIMLVVRTTGTAAITFYVDGVQVEEKTYATSYCDGTLSGGGYSWSGTAHSSASSRVYSGAIVTSNVARRINSLLGSYMAMVNIPDQDRTAVQPISIGQYGTNDWIGSNLNETSNLLSVRTKAGAGAEKNAAAGPVTFGSWVAIYGGWTPTNVEASFNAGTKSVVATRDAPSGTVSNQFAIGYGASSEDINGYIGPVAFFDRLLTVAEITKLKNLDPTLWWSALS